MAEEQHQQNGILDSAPPLTRQRRYSVDKDAQEMVIESLRTQIQDLISQVSQLNNKLVKSYDRVSDLEDDLHVASNNCRSSSLKISQLELERTQHLAALNTGLLVEKTHVTAELTRLMEKATEEAAQRGQAESARNAIEKDLDDLSASLFGQANTMVAEARFEKHLSERKVEDAQRALKSAEEAVRLMQTQMQTLQSEKEVAEKKSQEMELAMGKGKWVPRRDSDTAVSLRLLSAHSPYQEYMAFIAHLRVLHPTSPQQSPAMSTLLQLPFLTRLLTEDSEPTVRLDLAPSLNWLSRRSVLTAIHSGQLMIEPMLATTLFAESSAHPTSTTIAGLNSTNDNISCALCGVPIFPTTEPSQHLRPPIHPLGSTTHNHSMSWSGSFFKKAGSIGHSNGNTSPTRASIGASLNSQVFIFRLASPPTSAIASLPIPSLTKPHTQPYTSPIPSSYSSPITNGGSPQTGTPASNHQPTTIYPLCMSGWCLHRLRSTCTLWAFVRTGIVEKVWEEALTPPTSPLATFNVEKKNPAGEKPPLPPRKRGIWGIASAIGERAVSWSENDKDKAKRNSTSNTLPPAPPTHHPVPELRRVPPPLPPISLPKPGSVPPPLPKRHEKREKTPVTSPLPPVTAEDTNATASAPTSTTTPSASASDVQATTSTTAPVPTPATPTTTTTDPTPLPLTPIRGTHLRSSSTGVHPIRPSTPSNVPLPDSRPATPSRTTSPAVAIGAPSGPPPPIPRRAAARARGVGGGSRPGTPANAGVNVGGSRPGTPANANASNVNVNVMPEGVVAGEKEKGVEEEKEKGVEEVMAEAKESATTKESEGGTAAAANAQESLNHTEPAKAQAAATKNDDLPNTEKPTSKEPSSSSSSSSSPSSSVVAAPAQPLSRGSSESALYVDAPTPGETLAMEEEKAAAGDNENEEDRHTDTVVEKLDSAVEKAVVSGVLMEEPARVKGVEEDAEKEEKEKEVVDAEEALHDEEAKEKEKDKEEEAKTGVSYVGDATWEEKTWKEIVRLREDMFWARIGGIRE